MDTKQAPAGATIRALMRRAKPAARATSLARDGSAWTHGSLVLAELVRLAKRARRQLPGDANRS